MTRKISSVGKQLKCLEQVREFPLMSALTGRRSRRVSKGALIDAGPFSYKSRHAAEPLSDFEKMIIITTMAGNTGWSHLIPSNKKYAPYLPNYAGSAAGRTFPSAAGFHTMDLFFSDDSGIYFISTRDSKPSEHNQMAEDMDIDEWLKETWKLTKKISDERIQIPRKEPHIESHNLWVANTPGSLFAIPVTDLAQHVILGLCYFVQNGSGITDDFNKKNIPGLEKYSHLIDMKNLLPLSYLDQMAMAEATVELSTACFSGCLLLQAMGLGGWMYDGINPYSVFGVTGDPDNKGLGFKAEMKENWIFPNPTGLKGIFETMCPPHYPSMKEAVRAVVERKFGKGGPFHPDTPGAWKDTEKIRKSAAPHTEEFIECVTLMSQYILDTFGRFPATVPAAYSLMYLQAFHLDTEFYDRFYRPGSYLYTHAQHDKDWH